MRCLEKLYSIRVSCIEIRIEDTYYDKKCIGIKTKI